MTGRPYTTRLLQPDELARLQAAAAVVRGLVLENMAAHGDTDPRATADRLAGECGRQLAGAGHPPAAVAYAQALLRHVGDLIHQAHTAPLN